MDGTQGMTTVEQQTKLQPGDLVFTHPQDSSESIKRAMWRRVRIAPYLVLGIDPKARPHEYTGPWYRVMATGKVSGETKIFSLPENMLSKYEELL